MNKRLGFLLVLSATALAWVGCDGEQPAGDGGCPDGAICPGDDGGRDGGVADGGQRDAEPPVTGCMQATGRAGGTCRSGTTCGPGLTCFPPVTGGAMGAFTLRNIFNILTAVSDPENPGEFIAMPGLPDVPVGFGPGGQCTIGCNPESDMCPTCSSCETGVGGSPAFGAVGIQVGTFDVNDPPLTNDTNTGICRADCTFDPATNGGCQAGYSCGVSENVCLEACTADSQCNLDWGVTRRNGLVAVVEGDATCNTTTGRCQWTPPSSAAFGSECESDRDCGADVGACIFGHCSTWQCNLPDATGMTPRYPCAEGAVCVGFGSGGLCIATCSSPTECAADQACTPLFSDGSSACWGSCSADSQCQSDRRCRLGGFTNPSLGTCRPPCDPTAAETGCETNEACIAPEGVTTHGFCEQRGSVCTRDDTCLADEACEWLGNDGVGLCVPSCADDSGCAEGSFCRIAPSFVSITPLTADDRTMGRIRGTGDPESTVTVTLDGVMVGTATVAENRSWSVVVGVALRPIAEEAVIEATGSTDSSTGVCRIPGGACSPSPRRQSDMSLTAPVLRGDGSPQCVPWQTCSATMPDIVGTCVGEMPAPVE